MAQGTKTKQSDTKVSARTREAGDAALERLQDSVDAAEAALKDLRGEMSRGSRQLLTDVEKTLRDARRNLGRIRKRVVKDLEEVQRAATGRKATRRRGPTKSTAARARRARSAAK